MKYHLLIWSFIWCCVLHTFAEVNGTFSRNGVQYQVTKEDIARQQFEVSAVHMDSTYIALPDSVAYGEYAYAVTNTVQ